MKLKPMNAHIGSKEALTRKDMIFEIKLDGIRALCYVNGKLRFISRNDVDRTSKHPEFDFRKNIKAKTAILDGEIVAYDKKGRSDFSLLQRGGGRTEFVVFDILMKNGKILTALPLSERLKILKSTVKKGPKIRLSVPKKDGLKLWRYVKKHNLEGVMAKETNGTYHEGQRSYTWLKVKTIQTIDCVVVGYTQKKRLLSSLVLGLYDDEEKLHYIGHVGTGFSEEEIKKLYAKFSKIKAKKKYVVDVPKSIHGVQWIRPKYVAEIEYLEFTRHNRLRAPAFVRLRTDKKPKECTFEEQTK